MGNCLLSHLTKSQDKVALHYSPEFDALSEPSCNVTQLKLQNSRYLDPMKDNIVRNERGVVRIKVVISKQELKEMMVRKGGVDQMLSQLLLHDSNGFGGGTDNTDYYCKGWKPVLESIPEGNDCHY